MAVSGLSAASAPVAAEEAAAGTENIAAEGMEGGTVPGNGHVVCLDPGHQSYEIDMSAQEPDGPGSSVTKAKATSGTQGSYTGIPEYALNLDVSLLLRDILEKRGYKVVMTRTDNETAISNSERAIMAGEEGAEIFVRIHANGDSTHQQSGALALCPSGSNPYVAYLSAESDRLSSCILNAYCNATGFSNLGIQYNDSMTGINWSTVPVTILEMGFMTNEYDDNKMADEEFRQVMAGGIADGIDVYFGIATAAAEEDEEGLMQSSEENESFETKPVAAFPAAIASTALPERKSNAVLLSNVSYTAKPVFASDETLPDTGTYGDPFEANSDQAYQDAAYQDTAYQDPLSDPAYQDTAPEADPFTGSAYNTAPEADPFTGSAFNDVPEEIRPVNPIPQPDAAMQELIKGLKQRIDSMDGEWSVYVGNLSSGTGCGVYYTTQMQAASLIKLYIMGAVYERYEELANSYGAETLNSLLYSMITVSDNDAANTLTSYLGYGDAAAGMQAVTNYCTTHGYKSSHMGRLLLQPADPDDNYTSAEDCGYFLWNVYCNAMGMVSETGVQEEMEEPLDQSQDGSQTQAADGIQTQVPDGTQVQAVDAASAQSAETAQTGEGTVSQASDETPGTASAQPLEAVPVNPRASYMPGAAQMLSLLSQQTRRNKIPSQLPPGVSVANKTGELFNVENDAGIIYNTAGDNNLVICFMSQNVGSVGSAQAAIGELSAYIYNYYNG